VDVGPHSWTMYKSAYNPLTKSLDHEQIGCFEQVPLRLAWAVTIHKSQGKTFNKVALDLGYGAFAGGQIYVALSRCRTFKGLQLIKPVTPAQIRLDTEIVEFLAQLKKSTPEQTLLFGEDQEAFVYEKMID